MMKFFIFLIFLISFRINGAELNCKLVIGDEVIKNISHPIFIPETEYSFEIKLHNETIKSNIIISDRLAVISMRNEKTESETTNAFNLSNLHSMNGFGTSIDTNTKTIATTTCKISNLDRKNSILSGYYDLNFYIPLNDIKSLIQHILDLPISDFSTKEQTQFLCYNIGLLSNYSAMKQISTSLFSLWSDQIINKDDYSILSRFLVLNITGVAQFRLPYFCANNPSEPENNHYENREWLGQELIKMQNSIVIFNDEFIKKYPVDVRPFAPLTKY